MPKQHAYLVGFPLEDKFWKQDWPGGWVSKDSSDAAIFHTRAAAQRWLDHLGYPNLEIVYLGLVADVNE